MTRIKKVLVSQPKPENDKSPYFELAEKNNLKIDFRPFIQVDTHDRTRKGIFQDQRGG